MRSVVHSKIPPSDDHVRIEILPTCYFLHPVEGTKKCLISYYVQLKITSLQVALTADKYGITDIVQACAPILAKRVEAILLNVGALVSASSSERLRVSVKLTKTNFFFLYNFFFSIIEGNTTKCN